MSTIGSLENQLKALEKQLNDNQQAFADVQSANSGLKEQVATFEERVENVTQKTDAIAKRNLKTQELFDETNGNYAAAAVHATGIGQKVLGIEKLPFSDI